MHLKVFKNPQIPLTRSEKTIEPTIHKAAIRKSLITSHGNDARSGRPTSAAMYQSLNSIFQKSSFLFTPPRTFVTRRCPLSHPKTKNLSFFPHLHNPLSLAWQLNLSSLSPVDHPAFRPCLSFILRYTCARGLCARSLPIKRVMI